MSHLLLMYKYTIKDTQHKFDMIDQKAYIDIEKCLQKYYLFYYMV